MAVSPLLPRSPSNMNAGTASASASAAENAPARKSEAPRSLTVRSSVSGQPGARAGTGAARQAKSSGEEDSTGKQEFDLAERMNEEIAGRYVKGKKLGEGTFAVVYRGHLRSDPDKLVAIKKFKIPSHPEQRSEGLNVDSIREIKYLQELSHPSIVGLLDVFSTKDETINMVIEYFPNGNLEQLIKDKSVAYGAADVKAWMGMLTRAIYFCHANFILHRDIKPNNLLIGSDGEVKLADFGLARSFADPHANMTHVVITLWYRPPELLYGARHYSGAVDIWSTGMVLAELLLRTPYAATMSDQELAQLETICDAVGTPTEANWPGVTSLPNYVAINRHPAPPVRTRDYYLSRFPTAGAHGVDLLMSMLRLDPRRRITARACLEHAWWTVEPRPTDRENLPRQGGGSGGGATTADGEKKMAEAVARKPGLLVEPDEEEGVRNQRFRGVARKLDFGAME